MAEATFNSAVLDVHVGRLELIAWARRLQAQHSPGTQAMFFEDETPLDNLLHADTDKLINEIQRLLRAPGLSDIPIVESVIASDGHHALTAAATGGSPSRSRRSSNASSVNGANSEV